MNGTRPTNEERAARFAGAGSSQVVYERAKAARDHERKLAIRNGLIPDPKKRQKLKDAMDLVGTCEEMCPEFERIEREFQHAVDKWERDPTTGTISPARAVKTFHRPAAGDDIPLPSDVRPPAVLKRTLDYLVHDLVENNSVKATHHFIRDRTRSIRQDFTLQHDKGPLAIECHERIARLHIISLHEMREEKDFQDHLEMEQLRKVLTSLLQFYDDARKTGLDCPNEAEFRAYHLLCHLRDPDATHRLEVQPDHILDSRIIQVAMELHAVAQRNNFATGKKGVANTPAAQNLFSRFFTLISLPSTPFLVACLLETHFDDVRKGALRAISKSLNANNGLNVVQIHRLTETLGFNDDEDTAAFLEAIPLQVVRDPATNAPLTTKLDKQSQLRGESSHSAATPKTKCTRLVTSKSAGRRHSDFVDGLVSPADETPLVPPSPITPSTSMLSMSSRRFSSVQRPALSSFAPSASSTFPPSTSLGARAGFVVPPSNDPAILDQIGVFGDVTYQAFDGAGNPMPLPPDPGPSQQQTPFSGSAFSTSAFSWPKSTTNGSSSGQNQIASAFASTSTSAFAPVASAFAPASSSSSKPPKSLNPHANAFAPASSASMPPPSAAFAITRPPAATSNAFQSMSSTSFSAPPPPASPFALPVIPRRTPSVEMPPPPLPTAAFQPTPIRQPSLPGPKPPGSPETFAARRSSVKLPPSQSRAGSVHLSDSTSVPLMPSSSSSSLTPIPLTHQSPKTTVHLSPPPLTTSPPPIDDSADAPEQDLTPQIEALTQSTFTLMISAWSALAARTAVADSQRDRAIMRAALHRWIDRIIESERARRTADKGREELRKAIGRASWGTADGDDHDDEVDEDGREGSVRGGGWEGTVSVSRASSIMTSDAVSRRGRAMEDEEYLRAMEQAGAVRASLWNLGPFLRSIRQRVSSLMDAKPSSSSATRVPLVPPRWNIWLSTASDEAGDATVQWLRRKLDLEDPSTDLASRAGSNGRGVWRRLVGGTDSSGKESIVDSNFDSPGLIIYEVPRSFIVNSDDLAAQWQRELTRLQALMAAVPKTTGYKPSLVLVFWGAESAFSADFRTKMAGVINSSLLRTSTLRMSFQDIEIVTLSSASTADASFDKAVRSLDLSIVGHIPETVNISETLKPYTTSWNRQLARGMHKVSPSGLAICSRNFALLFAGMTSTLNVILTNGWRSVTSANEFAPPPPPPLPLFNFDEIETLPQLYDALTKYFSQPYFEDHPAADSFKSELLYSSNFRPDVLLASILKRLADTVVFDLVVACERMMELVDPPDASVYLKRFQRQLEDLVESIPPFSPDPAPVEENADAPMLEEELMPAVVTNGNGRKRGADEGVIQPNEKRMRVTPEPPVPKKGGSASVASLLKAVREARAKHSLGSSGNGTSALG